MDYNQILGNINNPQWCDDTVGIAEAKDLIGSNFPYWYASDISGKDSITVFTDHFIMVVREALSTNCVSNMTRDETIVFFDYLKWVDCDKIVDGESGCYDQNDYYTDLQAIIALDVWLTDEVQCKDHPTGIGCSEEEFTWGTCEDIKLGGVGTPYVPDMDLPDQITKAEFRILSAANGPNTGYDAGQQGSYSLVSPIGADFVMIRFMQYTVASPYPITMKLIYDDGVYEIDTLSELTNLDGDRKAVYDPNLGVWIPEDDAVWMVDSQDTNIEITYILKEETS